ncbi:hypothetical protein B9479_002282 [Cryptococcus floricola]|uniref:Uncharacterized protein n=1 Tax=Cryptococcus floricola TaxID=2591691 RepID=A0A5D3B4E7_9TREE|nr:hypothetical protein B9479_002282 [Cryptococcus floricola]
MAEAVPQGLTRPDQAVLKAPADAMQISKASLDGLPEPPIGEPGFLTRNLVLYYEINGVDYFTPHAYPVPSIPISDLPRIEGFNNFEPIVVI